MSRFPCPATSRSGKFRMSTWKSGFDSVDAVLSEGDDLILIRGTKFLLYDAATDTWSFPRPLTLALARPLAPLPRFRSITPFSWPGQQDLLLLRRVVASHDGERPSELADDLVAMGEPEQSHHPVEPGGRHAGPWRASFLFSGDEYVRYTGSKYQYVDVGYPRPIAGIFRQEDHSGSFPRHRDRFREPQARRRMGRDGVLHRRCGLRQRGGQELRALAQFSRSYPLEQVARVRNELLRRARVDAAFSRERTAPSFS